MSAPESVTCPGCGRDRDFVETHGSARSCYHPFHNAPTPRRDNSIYDDAAEYLAERNALMGLLKDARDLLDRIEEAQEFDPVTGETTIHPGEVMDGIGDVVDRIATALGAERA